MIHLIHPTCILTTSPVLTPNSCASFTVQCRCLCATKANGPYTSPAGQIIFIYARSLVSPDTLIGAVIHRAKVSPILTSTCVVFLLGPTTLTFAICHLSPTSVTVSSAANCPGWEISLNFLSSWPLPNSFSASLGDKWTCLLEIHNGILMI